MMRNIAVFVCCPLCPVRAGACKSNSHSLKRDHNPHQQQHISIIFSSPSFGFLFFTCPNQKAYRKALTSTATANPPRSENVQKMRNKVPRLNQVSILFAPCRVNQTRYHLPSWALYNARKEKRRMMKNNQFCLESPSQSPAGPRVGRRFFSRRSSCCFLHPFARTRK